MYTCIVIPVCSPLMSAVPSGVMDDTNNEDILTVSYNESVE